MNPLTEKLDACTKLLRKIKSSIYTWKLYQSTQVQLQYIGRTTKVVSMLLKLKELLLGLNTLIFLSIFYNKFLTMVSFFQNMKSTVSSRQICAPNHVQVLYSAVVLNGWLDSDFIQLVRQNTINPWDCINSLWDKWIIDRIYCANSRINLSKVGAASTEQNFWEGSPEGKIVAATHPGGRADAMLDFLDSNLTLATAKGQKWRHRKGGGGTINMVTEEEEKGNI